MKKIYLLPLILLIIFCRSISAQDDTTTVNPVQNSKTLQQKNIFNFEILPHKNKFQKTLSISRNKSNKYPLEIKVSKNDTINAYNYPVEFSIISKPDGEKKATLTDSITKTNINGIAKTFFKTGDKTGRFVVRAIANNDLQNPIYIDIDVKRDNWAFFALFGLLGGLSLFLYGMSVASKSLQFMAGTELNNIISRLTGNRIFGLFFGGIATFLVQSSSAVGVLLVGFTTAGLMTLKQSLGVLLGSNIGTTFTVQLISFNLGDYSLLILFIGFLVSIIPTNKNTKNIGKIIMGFGFIFFGMKLMSGSMTPFRSIPTFTAILTGLNDYPYTAIIISTIFTAIIQSSAATLGILLALSASGLLTLEASVPLIFGANIGTCITAGLASIGQSVEAKRVALVNVLFKVSGVLIFLPFLPYFTQLMTQSSPLVTRQIANTHTIFNITYSLLFLPLASLFALFTKKIIPESPNKKKKEAYNSKYLNTNLLASPELALDHVLRELLRMSEIIDKMLRIIPEQLQNTDASVLDRYISKDDKIDLLEIRIKDFLLGLSPNLLTDRQIKLQNAYLIIANNLESMGDIIVRNIYATLHKMNNQNVKYSDAGLQDIIIFHKHIIDSYRMIIIAMRKENKLICREVLDIKKPEIRRLELKFVKSHIDRLKKMSKETTESSSRHMDMINSLKRFDSLTNSIAHILFQSVEQ